MPTAKAKKRPSRPGRQINVHWTPEEDNAARTVARAFGLSVTDLVRMSVAAKCMELREELPKLDRPGIQIPLVRASMEGTLAVHMHDEGERLVASLDKKRN